ncbi:hypothetical protein MHYP_G00144750 [Metynnis hypsauchen]
MAGRMEKSNYLLLEINCRSGGRSPPGHISIELHPKLKGERVLHKSPGKSVIFPSTLGKPHEADPLRSVPEQKSALSGRALRELEWAAVESRRRVKEGAGRSYREGLKHGAPRASAEHDPLGTVTQCDPVILPS